MRRLSIGVAVLVSVGAGNVAFAQSKCDSTITKAAGKKVACKAGVVSKAQKSGGAPDATRLAKCEAKFAKPCGNGQAAGDCVVQTGSCAGIEGTVDACVTTLMGSAAPTTTTTLPACGNGVVESGEQCDGTALGFCPSVGVTHCGDAAGPWPCQCCLAFGESLLDAPGGIPCCDGGTCELTGPPLQCACGCIPLGHVCAFQSLPCCNGSCGASGICE